MKNQSTSDLLEKLRDELDQASIADPQAAERINDLIERIDTRMRDHVDEDGQRELLEEVQNEMAEFEVEHPDAAATIRSMLNMLSSLGL